MSFKNQNPLITFQKEMCRWIFFVALQKAIRREKDFNK